MEQSIGLRPANRRITRAALKQQVLDYLAGALPEGWISQPLSSTRSSAVSREALSDHLVSMPAASAGDVLVISPRGRCHFLFVRAPADRWWDGGLRRVEAEVFSAKDERLARQLRAAGHKARAIRCDQDLNRALKAWGCPLTRQADFTPAPRSSVVPASRMRPPRPTLRLRSLGGRTDG